MPTIKDVAEKAGVGIATVSRAMNGTGYVSARSREKIETAIREQVDCIVTRNTRDYAGAALPVLEPDAFLKKLNLPM